MDRLLWVWLSRFWSDWRTALAIVEPETVVAWHRKGFRLFWTWKVRRGQPGRPGISREVRDLIRKRCRENSSWGALRIHGELLKLGICRSSGPACGESVNVFKYRAAPSRLALKDRPSAEIADAQCDWRTLASLRLKIYLTSNCSEFLEQLKQSDGQKGETDTVFQQLSAPFRTVEPAAILVGRGSHGAQERTPHRIRTAESAGGSDLFEALVRTLQLPARRFGPHLQNIVGWRFSQLARKHALEIPLCRPREKRNIELSSYFSDTTLGCCRLLDRV